MNLRMVIEVYAFRAYLSLVVPRKVAMRHSVLEALGRQVLAVIVFFNPRGNIQDKRCIRLKQKLLRKNIFRLYTSLNIHVRIFYIAAISTRF